MAAMVPAFQVVMLGHMAMILQQTHATTVQLGGPVLAVLSNVHPVQREVLELLMRVRVSHVLWDSTRMKLRLRPVSASPMGPSY